MILKRSLAMLAAGPALAAAVAAAPAIGAIDKGFDIESKSSRAPVVSTAAAVEIAETEPNELCPGQAIACGDAISGAIDQPGDVDFYSFSAEAGACLTLVTDRSPGQAQDTDTRIELLSQDCNTVLASDDDSGPGVFAAIRQFTAPYTGNFVVRVRHFSATAAGPYRLRVSCDPGAPINSTCATAVPLACGEVFLEGSTFCSGNDLAFPSDDASCTSFTTNGEDIVYTLSVTAGSSVDLVYQSSADASMYILGACSIDSCVAGSDETLTGSAETLSYTFASDGDYYLVLDSFGTGSAGTFTLTGTFACKAVPVSPVTWGLVKARFAESP